MNSPHRLDELLARFTGSPDEDYEVEYVGRFRVSGAITLGVLNDKTAEAWRRSVVPDVYMPLYGLKCGPPEYAGGLFDAAPFAAYDESDIQYSHRNMPTPPKPIFDLCRDRCGCPFWVSSDGIVYGHSLNNEIQQIGALADFVDFSIDLALAGVSWYERVNESGTMSRFRLAPINTMG